MVILWPTCDVPLPKLPTPILKSTLGAGDRQSQTKRGHSGSALRCRQIWQILAGSFSAVSKPILACKRSFCGIFQDLQGLRQVLAYILQS